MCCRSHSLACSLSCSAATRQLVDDYKRKCEQLESATLNQLKLQDPFSKVSSKKVPVKLKLEEQWGSRTLADLNILVIRKFKKYVFHLQKVEDGCIAVTWLCSTSEIKQLKMAILKAADSLQTEGVLQVFIGEKELVLECPVTGSVYYHDTCRLCIGTADVIIALGYGCRRI